MLRSGADKIAAKLGVRSPQIYLIDDGFPRLFVVGRGPWSSSSRGLGRGTAVAASRGARGRDRTRARPRPPDDVLVQTFVVLFATTLVETSRIGGWFSRVLLYVFAPISAAFVHVMLSPRRELHADALAASASGAAHDLADALMRLDRAAELVEFAASPATEPPIRSTRSSPTASPGCSRRTRLSTHGFVACASSGAGQNGRVPESSLSKLAG